MNRKLLMLYNTVSVIGVVLHAEYTEIPGDIRSYYAGRKCRNDTDINTGIGIVRSNDSRVPFLYTHPAVYK